MAAIATILDSPKIIVWDAVEKVKAVGDKTSKFNVGDFRRKRKNDFKPAEWSESRGRPAIQIAEIMAWQADFINKEQLDFTHDLYSNFSQPVHTIKY